MKIFFDLDEPNERGTSVAISDYALFAKLLLQAEVTVGHLPDPTSGRYINRLGNQIQLAQYKTLSDRDDILRSGRFDVLYRLMFRKRYDRYVPNIYNANHLVFDYVEPRPDASAYISPWLSAFCSASMIPSVPHIVTLPQPTNDLRTSLKLSSGITVIGRYGGKDTFDIPFVQTVVKDVLDIRNDIVFLFANTNRFYDHKRIIYLDTLYEKIDKSNFISTCDAMLHARYIGESFGLAIAEFLFHDKPVFCWAGGRDRNHVIMQPSPENLYRGYRDLKLKLLEFNREKHCGGTAREAVSSYMPDQVMKQFRHVFLDNTKNNGMSSLVKSAMKIRKKSMQLYRASRDVLMI